MSEIRRLRVGGGVDLTERIDATAQCYSIIVKIDVFSFAATGGKARQILFHMASLASCVTPIVVLKGVETYEQLETARTIGVTHVQGFLLSEPTLVPEFASGMPWVRVSHGQPDTLH